MLKKKKKHLRGFRGMNISQTGGQIIRAGGAADTAEQCMNVFLTNKNTSADEIHCGGNFQASCTSFEESIPGNGARWGRGSIRDDTIISYFLTLCLRCTTPRRMSCGRLNEDERREGGGEKKNK